MQLSNQTHQAVNAFYWYFTLTHMNVEPLRVTQWYVVEDLGSEYMRLYVAKYI